MLVESPSNLRPCRLRYRFLVLTFAGWVNRHQDDLIAYLREENRVLREHLGPRPLRLTDAQRRRLAVRGQKLGRRVLMQVAGIVTPDTILRWYRRLIAQTYDGSARRGRGRPMTRRDVAARVVRMAVENPQWGYTRIRGALSNLSHEIARTTVKRILHDHGIDPAPERSRRMPWKTFLQAHWEGLTACDLFTVEVLTLAGLQRYLVFFVIALQSRRVTIAGIHPQPYGTWMEQMARNLTDPVDGCLRRARYLIHDRDPLYTRVFGEILEGGGVQPIRLPPKSPNLNAYAERFVRPRAAPCETLARRDDGAALGGRRGARSGDGVPPGARMSRYARAGRCPPGTRRAVRTRGVVRDGCVVVNQAAAEFQQRTGHPPTPVGFFYRRESWHRRLCPWWLGCPTRRRTQTPFKCVTGVAFTTLWRTLPALLTTPRESRTFGF